MNAAARRLLALGYMIAGILHFVFPAPLIAIAPKWVPHPALVVALTGIAEAAGAVALAQPWSQPLRRAGGIGLALYALGVFPANINHMLIDMARPHPQLGWGYHVPRLLLQPVLIWLALWTSRSGGHEPPRRAFSAAPTGRTAAGAERTGPQTVHDGNETF